MPECIPFDEKNTKEWKFATEAALEVIGTLDIARGKAFVIPVPSKGITAEERLRLKLYNRKISQKSSWLLMLVQSMGTNALVWSTILEKR